MKRLTVLPVALAAVFLSSVLPGCAAMQRETRARELAGDYVYERPLAEVFPHVRALLVSHGYTPVEATPLQIDTEWRQEVSGSDSGATYSRYTVIAKDAGNRCVVRFLKSSRTGPAREVVGRSEAQTGGGMPSEKEDGPGRSTETAGTHGTAHKDLSGSLKGDEDETREILAESQRGTQVPKAVGARDLNMEWLLLQRVEPEAAAQIYAKAETTEPKAQ